MTPDPVDPVADDDLDGPQDADDVDWGEPT